jgi:hypothetical protein
MCQNRAAFYLMSKQKKLRWMLFRVTYSAILLFRLKKTLVSYWCSFAATFRQSSVRWKLKFKFDNADIAICFKGAQV